MKVPSVSPSQNLITEHSNSLHSRFLCTDSCASGCVLLHTCLFARPVFLPARAGLKGQVAVRAFRPPTAQTGRSSTPSDAHCPKEGCRRTILALSLNYNKGNKGKRIVEKLSLEHKGCTISLGKDLGSPSMLFISALLWAWKQSIQIGPEAGFKCQSQNKNRKEKEKETKEGRGRQKGES